MNVSGPPGRGGGGRGRRGGGGVGRAGNEAWALV